MTQANAYDQIITKVFEDNFHPGSELVDFTREELAAAAGALGIPVPKNLGDIVYTFRYRRQLPAVITSLAPAGKSWGDHALRHRPLVVLGNVILDHRTEPTTFRDEGPRRDSRANCTVFAF